MNRTRDFLDKYTNQTHCGQYCFNLEQLGVCGSEPYGYDEGKPCVYLKLNKVFGLENEMFDELPKDMPETLKEHINAQDKKIKFGLNAMRIRLLIKNGWEKSSIILNLRDSLQNTSHLKTKKDTRVPLLQFSFQKLANADCYV